MNGNIYACSWYLDIVSPGWCALVEDNYERVFPLPVFEKGGITFLRQPSFTQQLGIFYQTPMTDGKLEEFLKSAEARYRYIYINLNTSNKIAALGPESEMTNLELDLITGYAKIAAGYQTNLQRNIRKASQQKLMVSKHVRPEEIISLFKANKGQTLRHLDENHYTLVQRIAYESINKGIGEIWGAFDEHNELIAAILWITSHQKCVFMFSAVSQTGKQLNAMPWLIDAFIRQNAGKPLTLDFEGSNDAGLARFYSSFGARRVIYQRYIINTLPYYVRFALKIWQLTRKQIKKIF
jgi:hypothetical protein